LLDRGNEPELRRQFASDCDRHRGARWAYVDRHFRDPADLKENSGVQWRKALLVQMRGHTARVIDAVFDACLRAYYSILLVAGGWWLVAGAGDGDRCAGE